MANLFIDLDLGGAPADVSKQGKTKTIIAAGDFSGNLILEANCGGEWREVLRFNSPGNKTLDAALKEVRINTGGIAGSVDQVTISADDTGAKFVELPVNGAAVDVSALGTFNTVVIGGDSLNGLLKILISDDGVDWTDWKSYQNATIDSEEVVAQFMKATYTGTGAPEVCVGAINETDSTAAPVTAYVWRPGAAGSDAAEPNVYTGVGLEGFTEVWDALQSTKDAGPRELWFDSTFSPDSIPGGASVSGPTCLIPAGTWDMEDVMWRSREKGGPVLQEVNVSFEDQAFCPNLERIELTGNLWHEGLHSPFSSVFSAGQIGHPIFAWDNVAGLPLVAIVDAPGSTPSFQFYAGCQFQSGGGTLFSTPNTAPSPLIDVGDDFIFVQSWGVNMVDNVFMASGTGSAGFVGSGSAVSGGHSWLQPGLVNGFFVVLLCAGGYFPRTYPVSADFDLYAGRRYQADTSAGPINAQMFDSFAEGQMVTIFDDTGDCGINNVEVLAPLTFGTIEEPYLNRPGQSKTWISNDDGNWILDKNAYEEFVTGVIIADQVAVNNATNIVDSSAGAFDLTLPLAATAKKGSIIRVASDGSGGANVADILPSGADTIAGVASVGNLQNVAYQSDGVSKWIQIS